MNRYEISKGSLASVVSHTINADKQIRLHHKKYLNLIPNRPLKLKYNSKARISVYAQVETLFGKDIVKVIDKAAETIRKNLEELTSIKVSKIILRVKDVFNEVTDN